MAHGMAYRLGFFTCPKHGGQRTSLNVHIVEWDKNEPHNPFHSSRWRDYCPVCLDEVFSKMGVHAMTEEG